jgi:hypothetical protein
MMTRPRAMMMPAVPLSPEVPEVVKTLFLWELIATFPAYSTWCDMSDTASVVVGNDTFSFSGADKDTGSTRSARGAMPDTVLDEIGIDTFSLGRTGVGITAGVGTFIGEGAGSTFF